MSEAGFGNFFFDGDKEQAGEPYKIDIIDAIRDRELKVTPFEKGTDTIDDGQITDRHGQVVSPDELGKMFSEINQEFQDARSRISDAHGKEALLDNVTFRGETVPVYKLFDKEGGEEALNTIFPDNSDDIQRACELKQMSAELTHLRSDSMVESQKAYAVGLSENYGKQDLPVGMDLIK
jgi:hypothetical protein